MELGWIKRTKAKVRSNARDHGRGEDAKIGEKRSDTGTRESLRSVDRVRVPASMKLNLIPASSRARSSEAEVGGVGGVADHRHPRKGGAPRGVRLTRHPAGSSHSYCQLPTLRPSRSSLASDLRSFQPLSACSSYVANLTFLFLALPPTDPPLLRVRYREPNLPTWLLCHLFILLHAGRGGRSFANVKRKEERERILARRGTIEMKPRKYDRKIT